jgi:hypothetical protein
MSKLAANDHGRPNQAPLTGAEEQEDNNMAA